MTNKVFLVGPMGAGKSAVGKALARLMKLHFADSDGEIESRTGVDIDFIFEKEGEDGFRKRESKVIDELTQRDTIVLATGGGAICTADNRRWLASRGTVVYLETSVDQQHRRTGARDNRPMLKNGDPRTVLEELMTERDPHYREVADVIVNTDNRRVKEVADEICTRLGQLV